MRLFSLLAFVVAAPAFSARNMSSCARREVSFARLLTPMKTRQFFLALPLLLAIPALAQDVPAAPTPPEGMVYVPAGEFQMGTNNADGSDFNQRDNTPLNSNDARPQHQAQTGAFFIDVTEVTNAQYQKYCAATGAATPPHWTNGEIPEGQADFPVHHVNWYEASAYAKWSGKRLPTETEWEKAARGTDGRRFPWGNEFDGNKIVNGGDGPQVVGKRAGGASPYGALDMSGNVDEWTTSWFDGYPKSPTKQPDFGTTLKVVRGGAWFSGESLGQTWYRSVARPRTRIKMIGFRCVQDATKSV